MKKKRLIYTYLPVKHPVPSGQEIVSSNQLRNANSYEFLQFLFDSFPRDINGFLLPRLPDTFDLVIRLIKAPYDSGYAYGDVYTAFMQSLEEYIERNPNDDRINNLVCAVFVNVNNALKRAYETVAKEIRAWTGKPEDIQSLIQGLLSNSKLEDKVLGYLMADGSLCFFSAKENPDADNKTNPSKRETKLEKGLDFVDPNFKPQNTTCQPSVRVYKYKNISDPEELRLGTQAQRHQGKPRVSPLFKKFIQIQAKDPLRRLREITHVYFNDLGRDDLSGIENIERSREAVLTDELKKLEHEYKNIAVITLPSDKGFMSISYTKGQSVVTDPYKQLLDIVCDESEEQVKDFHISDIIRKKLFASKVEIEELLTKSFKELGLYDERNTEVSQAEFQAVWFYFTKYTLSNFILEKLNPLTFQMSCKDGIDRGGVHSALFNLMKSFEQGREPMSLEEFEQAIDAAPILVKGRGMNGHRIRLWNVINQYVKANKDLLEKDEKKKWLIDWCNNNTPIYARDNKQLKCKSEQKSVKVQFIFDSQGFKFLIKEKGQSNHSELKFAYSTLFETMYRCRFFLITYLEKHLQQDKKNLSRLFDKVKIILGEENANSLKTLFEWVLRENKSKEHKIDVKIFIELFLYLFKRGSDPREYYGMFSRTCYHKKTKLNAAAKLFLAVYFPSADRERFTIEEAKAILETRLIGCSNLHAIYIKVIEKFPDLKQEIIDAANPTPEKNFQTVFKISGPVYE